MTSSVVCSLPGVRAGDHPGLGFGQCRAGRVPVVTGESWRLVGGNRVPNSSGCPRRLRTIWPPLDQFVASPRARESMRPGTAKTWRPYSIGEIMVIRGAAGQIGLHHDGACDMPATMRLRMGKLCLSAGRLNGTG